LYFAAEEATLGRSVGRGEYVGLCPLHQESRPSFYVNARKDVFYCHGCGQGGDLFRFLQLSERMSFRESLACLDHAAPRDAASAAVLEQAAVFYEQQLERYPEALGYLRQRGVHDPVLMRQLRIGYAAGGSLRRYLRAQGHSFELLQLAGLITARGVDALYQRVVFPLYQDERIVNLYGRSIGDAFAHRFLPGGKGGLYAWDQVRHYPEIILVEGLFDYAALRQAGFVNVTCSLGTHLNADQLRHMCDGQRTVYVAFDVDANRSGQCAAEQLVRYLGARGIAACRVLLPEGHDPNSFFLAGGTANQFQSLLEAAQP
jgi:DNA primase